MTTQPLLETVWAQVQEALDRTQLPVYPAIPELEATAEWPGQDWEEFMAIANRCGADMFYVETALMDDEEIARFEQETLDIGFSEAATVDISSTEPQPSQEGPDLVTKLKRYRNKLFEVTLGFMHGGVLHRWTGRAYWWEEIVARAAQLRAAEVAGKYNERRIDDKQSAALAGRANKEKWAAKLAEDPQFIGAVSRETMTAVALETFPDLKAFAEGDSYPSNIPMIYDLVTEARSIVEQEVKARFTKQALDELDLLAAEVAADPEWKLASTKPARMSIVKRFLKSRYGFVMPTVADHLAGRKL